MYLRLSKVRFEPALADQMVSLAEVGAVEARLPGATNVFRAVDRGTGALVSISLWDAEHHARFSREELGDTVGRVLALRGQVDPPESYEIVD